MSILDSELLKRVDDAVREELLGLGWEYSEVIREIAQETRSGDCVIRFFGDRPDLDLQFTDQSLDDEALRARIRRRLRVALEGPNPFAEPIDGGPLPE